MVDEVEHLKQLGDQKTVYTSSPSCVTLETFPNKFPGRLYVIELNCPEFTSLCPKTGQPDFAVIEIYYTPDEKCIETKSLKLYLFSFRNYGSFMETITNRILDDLVVVCQPRTMLVMAQFNTRGGIKLTVKASYEKDVSEKK